MHDVIIIGGGIAGLTAAIYTSRAGLDTVILEGEPISNTQLPGGQLALTPEIENYPGFMGSGDDLIEKVRDQVTKFGATIIELMAESIDLVSEIKVVTDSEGVEHSATAVIIATGSVARRLNVENEDKFFGRGVSVCATCDGAFYKGLDTIVVGGGHVAVEDALHLSNLANTVHVIHRRDELRAKSPEARALLQASNVEFHWNEEVDSVLADNRVAGVRLKSGKSVEADGVFIAIGHDPDTSLFQEVLEVDSFGYLLKESGSSRTSLPGVFVAGDVADSVYRQAITAAGTGCMAALDAQHYLSSLK